MTTSSTIRRLPPHLINRIAAGEVVERPASVVKELVENALDAGATQVEVVVGQGGRTLRIADNGSGMTRENVVLAFENHATSKLQPDDDLTNIATLGFRGEALASISAVSRFTCDTRRADEPHGTRVTIEGGSPPVVSDCGCAPGTVMMVDELFFNTPARLKFLKRPATELAAVEDALHLLALSHPDVRFGLTLNGKTAFQTPGDGSLTTVLAAVLKSPTLSHEHVLPVSFQDPVSGARVSALIATPAATGFHYKSKRGWWQLLNGRGIKCQLLNKAMAGAFQGLIPDGVYPLCVVHLQLPPDQVDVNVHPAKREVRYQRPSEVFALVRHALRQAMETQFQQAVGLVPSVSAPSASSGGWPVLSDASDPPRSIPWAASPSSTTGNKPYPAHRPSPAQVQQALSLYEPVSASNHALVSSDRGLPPPLCTASPVAQNWRVIGQLFHTYILLETPKGLMVVDQHIASERWGYERLMNQLQGTGGSTVQPLAVPMPLPLPPGQTALLRQHEPELAELGFTVSWDENDTPYLASYPLIYPGRGQLSPTEQVAHLLHQWETAEQAEPDWERLTSTLACHTAVRAGDTLTHAQMEQVVRDWLACQLPWSCPHGRPIAHTIEATELNQFFDRPSLPVNALSQ
jgi:DNA mismatch repair protein MutL